MRNYTIVLFVALLAASFSFGCVERNVSVSLADFEYTVPPEPYKTTVACGADPQTNVYVGKVMDTKLRSGAQDMILFEDGVILPVYSDQDLIWVKGAVQRVTVEYEFGSASVKRLEVMV